MGSIVRRFREGVHEKGMCGSNIHGYAAIDAAISGTNIYELEEGKRFSGNRSNLCKKKSFLHTDIFTYMLLRAMCENKMEHTYILLLHSQSMVSATVRDMIKTINSGSGIVIVVYRDHNAHKVDVSLPYCSMSETFTSDEQLVSFMDEVSSILNAVVLVYPEMDNMYVRIASIKNIYRWYIPVRKGRVYISGDGKYKHTVFPWSRSPSCTGFTTGSGTIVDAGTLKSRHFESSFYYYENMISSVPFSGMCIDCYILKIAADMIDCINGTRMIRHRHTMSEDSLEALDHIKSMLLSSSSES